MSTAPDLARLAAVRWLARALDAERARLVDRLRGELADGLPRLVDGAALGAVLLDVVAGVLALPAPGFATVQQESSTAPVVTRAALVEQLGPTRGPACWNALPRRESVSVSVKFGVGV